jgi:FkbM family methyltransferase
MMIRERLIETATRLGFDEQLRNLRDTLPGQRRNRILEQNIHLLFMFTLAEDSNCIDIGAYRGKVLSQMVQLAPHGKHIAYEPQPEKHRALVEAFPSVDVRCAAVSNEIGETTFNMVTNLPGYSGLREISYPRRPQIEKLTVRTETLDGSLPEGYVPHLIKIDVEGAEGLVFEGGIETITKYQPMILFEHGKAGANHYGTGPRRIYELLHDKAGLRIFDLEGNGPYSLRQFEASCAEDIRWDYLAHR